MGASAFKVLEVVMLPDLANTNAGFPAKFELQMAMRHILVYVCLMQYMEECISIMSGRSLGNEEMSVVDTVGP